MAKFVCDSCCEIADGNPCILNANDDVITPHSCAWGGDANWLRCEKSERSEESKSVSGIYPEWYKVGGWVWSIQYGYGKVERIDDDGISKVIFHKLSADDNSRLMSVLELAEARVRPWSFEEAPFMAKVKDKNGKVELLRLHLESSGNFFFRYEGYTDERADFFAQNYTLLDGSPCGVFEHRNDRGEWVQ